MAVRLLFLGRLEDVAGAVELDARPGRLTDIIATLDPALALAIGDARVRIAVNGAVVADRDGLALTSGDEVAFLPPVSGG